MSKEIHIEINRNVSESDFLKIKNTFKKYFGIIISRRSQSVIFSQEQELDIIANILHNGLKADNVMYLVSVDENNNKLIISD